MVDGIAGALLVAVSSKAVKALVSGDPPASGDYADLASSAVERILGEVLAVEDQTLARLERIEQKIDHLLLGQYLVPMRSGYRNLDWATKDNRSDEERRRHLHIALEDFARASDAAYTPEAAVEAELLVATCWLALGQPPDFLDSAASAAECALAGVLLAGVGPDDAAVRKLWESRADRFERIARAFGGAGMASERAELRREAAQMRADCTALFNRVQDLRHASGVDRPECPRAVGFLGPSWTFIDVRDTTGAGIGVDEVAGPMVERHSCPILEHPARIPGISVGTLTARLQPARVTATAPFGRSAEFLRQLSSEGSRLPWRAPATGRRPRPGVSPARSGPPRVSPQAPRRGGLVIVGIAQLQAGRGIGVEAAPLGKPRLRLSRKRPVRRTTPLRTWNGALLDAAALPASVRLRVDAGRGPSMPSAPPTHLIVRFQGLPAPRDARIRQMSIAFAQPITKPPRRLSGTRGGRSP